MHAPDPDAKRKPLTPEQIEANRVAAREYRVRQKKSVTVFPGRIGPGAMNAAVTFFRHQDGLSREEAEAKASDPEEISKLAFEVLETVWAPQWFAFLKKLRRPS